MRQQEIGPLRSLSLSLSLPLSASFRDADTARDVINSVGSVKTRMGIGVAGGTRIRRWVSLPPRSMHPVQRDAARRASNAPDASHASGFSDRLESSHENRHRPRVYGDGTPRRAI